MSKARCLFLIIAVFCLSACARPKPFQLGFSSALTGRQSSLGREVYEGALLAVEERLENEEQVQIELIVRDDAGDPALALKNNKEFSERGLEAVTGHATSAVAASVLPFLAEKGMVFIGASTSSPLFDGLDDPLFRVVNSSVTEAHALADYAASKDSSERFIAIYDMRNAAYAAAWVGAFIDRYEARGGKVSEPVPFDSSTIANYREVVDRAISADPSATGLCIVASPIDTAAVCQAFRARNGGGTMVTGGWANNQDLIRHGGQAVEGMLIGESYDFYDTTPAHLAFIDKYKKRFGKDPAFGAAHSYEAIQYLAEALRIRKRGESLKNALSRVPRIQGLQSVIRFDATGDAFRPLFLIQVQKGAFHTLGKVDNP